MKKAHTTYSPEAKLEMVLNIMKRKTTIQKVARENNIAATLISLWKKQAEDAILERYSNRRHNRRKAEPVENESPSALRIARKEARIAKTRASRLEASLKTAKERVATLEAAIQQLAASLDCKVVKNRTPRSKKA